MSQYRSHFSYWETFDKKRQTNSFFLLVKSFLTFLKWILLLFMVIIFFWGLGTLFFDKDVKTTEIEILNPEGIVKEKTYISGVFFELISGYQEELIFKNHVFHMTNGEIYEYDYRAAQNVDEMLSYSSSPFYAFLVLPTSWLMNKIAFALSWSKNALGLEKNLISMIFTIFFTSLILRIFTSAGTWKQQQNQLKMKRIQSKIDLIKEKYKDQNSAEAKQKSQWEIMSLYRKENINPLGSALEGFAFAPFLFAMFVVVRTSRILKDSSTETFSFTTNIWEAISNNQEMIYLIPVLVYFCLFAFDNFLLTRYIEKKTIAKQPTIKKKSKFSQTALKWAFKVLFFIFFFIVPVGTSVYWIFSSFFESVQKSILFQVQKYQKKQKILEKKGKDGGKWYGISNFLKPKKLV